MVFKPKYTSNYWFTHCAVFFILAMSTINPVAHRFRPFVADVPFLFWLLLSVSMACAMLSGSYIPTLELDGTLTLRRKLFKPVVLPVAARVTVTAGTSVQVGNTRFTQQAISNWSEFIAFIESAEKAGAIQVVRKEEKKTSKARQFMLTVGILLAALIIPVGLYFALPAIFPQYHFADTPTRTAAIYIYLFVLLAVVWIIGKIREKLRQN